MAERLRNQTEFETDSKRALVFIGPPTSGKTSHALRTAELWGARAIQGRDIVPELVSDYERGRFLIPDSIFLYRLAMRLSRVPVSSGRQIVFDNIPRTRSQAELLIGWARQEGFKLFTILLKLEREEILYRFNTRLACPVDGESYHPLLKPSRIPNICDKHNVTLVKRTGDNEENLDYAIGLYESQLREIYPVLNDNSELLELSAEGPVGQVFTRISSLVPMQANNPFNL